MSETRQLGGRDDGTTEVGGSPETALAPPIAAVQSGPIRHCESSFQNKSAKTSGLSAVASLDTGDRVPATASAQIVLRCGFLCRMGVRVGLSDALLLVLGIGDWDRSSVSRGADALSWRSSWLGTVRSEPVRSRRVPDKGSERTTGYLDLRLNSQLPLRLHRRPLPGC